MRSIKITIPFTPKPKASVRFKKVFYNPSNKGMGALRSLVDANLAEDWEQLEGPLFVISHYRMPVPKHTHTAKKKRLHCTPHAKKPDGDNLEKFLNDAFKGLLWKDDAQISWLLRSKTHTSELKGEIVLYVREMGEGKIDYSFMLEDIEKHIKVE